MSGKWRGLASRLGSPKEGSVRPGTAVHGDSENDPDTCVFLLSGAGLQQLTAVKRALAHATADWVNRFLELDGLDALFGALDRFSTQGTFQDAVLQLHCVECLRALMNLRTGLDHIVQHPIYTRKLAQALASPNRVVRKQVFELLSAICVYAPAGHDLALDALDHLKVSDANFARPRNRQDHLCFPIRSFITSLQDRCLCAKHHQLRKS